MIMAFNSVTVTYLDYIAKRKLHLLSQSLNKLNDELSLRILNLLLIKFCFANNSSSPHHMCEDTP